MAARVLVLRDEGTGTANRLLDAIETRARAAGYDTVVGLDPLDPKGEPCVLAVPEAALALIVLNGRQTLQTPAERTVHMRRFFAPEFLREHRNYLAFQSAMQETLLERNCLLLRQAKETHDRLERFYIAAMDFDALKEKTGRLLEQLLPGDR